MENIRILIIIGIILGFGVLLYMIKQFEKPMPEDGSMPSSSIWVSVPLIAIFSYLYFTYFGVYTYLISIILIVLIM
jgi:hypothetical protein